MVGTASLTFFPSVTLAGDGEVRGGGWVARKRRGLVASCVTEGLALQRAQAWGRGTYGVGMDGLEWIKGEGTRCCPPRKTGPATSQLGGLLWAVGVG